MKETDIRARINAFLEANLRRMMVPVGLGMALAAGCSPEPAPLYAAPSDGAASDSAGEAAVKYMGPMPDAQPYYAAVFPDAQAAKYMGPMPDGASDDAQVGVLYMAAMPQS